MPKIMNAWQPQDPDYIPPNHATDEDGIPILSRSEQLSVILDEAEDD